jgi:chromatin remodeling complex protein RSC6
MASEDDKQEEEEFEDLPSDVEGDASEVGNTSAQEKFDKLKKAVKESSKDNGKKSKKENKKKEKEEEKKKEDSKQEKKKKGKKEEKKRRKKKRREEREHLHHLHHHPHHPHHHLHLVRMEMGMTSTMAQEFPREHSSQNPRLSPRMTIEAYPLTMILWKQNLKMISLYPLASYPNLMGLTLLNGSI